MAVVGRMFIIKAVFEIVQYTTFQVAGSKWRSVDQIIVVSLNCPSDGFDPLQPLIADVPQLVGVLHLINGVAVSFMREKRLLPFLLVVHTVLDQLIKLRAFLPFLTGHGEDTVMGIQVSGVKSHRRILALLDNVNGQVPLHQLIGSFFRERQKVAVHVAALFQIILGQCRVRHGVFVQRLLLGIRQLSGCGFCGLLAGLFLQGLDHRQRSIPDGFAAHPQVLADMADHCGAAQVRPIQLAAVQLLHG